jgi:hypothetical protein
MIGYIMFSSCLRDVFWCHWKLCVNRLDRLVLMEREGLAQSGHWVASLLSDTGIEKISDKSCYLLVGTE